jgi:hypothetical protein
MHANFRRGVTVAAFAVVLTTSGVAAQPARLPPSEIETTFFNGQPFTASTLSNVKFKMTFTADNKIRREPIGSGIKGMGTWKLSKDGFCTTWGGATVANCFTLVNAGANKWSVMKGSTIQAIWTK